jgi:hypothetical protein
MEKKTKLDLIKEGYEAARDNKPEKKCPIGDKYPSSYYQPLFDHMRDQHGLILLSTEMSDIIELLRKLDSKGPATPTGAIWVKASDRLPKEAGPITWRWLDKEAAYSGFNGTAFIYDKGGAQVDMLYAIEIEWLDEPNNTL